MVRPRLTLTPLAVPLLLACASAPPAPAPAPAPAATAPRFIEDDADRAFADAKETRRAVFVDTWATWCHSCLALKNEVLNDPKLGRFSDHFVFLSLDVERASAAPFLAAHPQPAYPTLWILRADGTPLLRWVGTLTEPQLEDLLDDAVAAMAAPTGSPTATATTQMLAAEAAAAEGKPDDAIAGYRAALATAPNDWPRRSRTANALQFLLASHDRNGECVNLALDEMLRLPAGGAGRADLIISGIDCASELGAGDNSRKLALSALLPIAVQIAHDATLLADDRSGAWMAVIDAYDGLGEAAAKRQAQADWAAFLEDVVAHAKTPADRAVYDSHLMLAYLAVGRGPDAIAALEKSERDFPDDYNPPARKAYALLELGRADEALIAIERALSLAYGPRRLGMHLTESRIYDKLGDRKAQLAALKTGLDEAAALPEAQRPTRLMATVQKTYDGMKDALERTK